MADEKSTSRPDVEKDGVATHIAVEEATAGEATVGFLKHANDADEAMRAFAGHEGEVLVLDEATNKRLLRKIDWNLMPVSTIHFSHSTHQSFCTI